MNEPPTWKQEQTIHCPGLQCKGMLLQHSYYHYHWCSDCKKYWMGMLEWEEYIPKESDL